MRAHTLAVLRLQFMITFLEQLTPVMMASIEGQLQQNGGSVVTFLPDNSVLALLTPAALEAAESLPGGAGHRPILGRTTLLLIEHVPLLPI